MVTNQEPNLREQEFYFVPPYRGRVYELYFPIEPQSQKIWDPGFCCYAFDTIIKDKGINDVIVT